MIWIITAVIVLGLFALGFAGADRYRKTGDGDTEAVRHTQSMQIRR